MSAFGDGRVDRRKLLLGGAAGLAGLALGPDEPAGAAGEGETLHNGIRLPAAWPPQGRRFTLEPEACPYLASPPAVIPIDLGRQLFVDDFLIAETDLRRRFHRAEFHPACPVLKPDRPWEIEGSGPTAMVFSDGVWYDPADRLFKLWYMGGYVRSTCLATSKDGIRWDKPAFDVRPGTNIVHPHGRDSAVVWLDQEEKDPARRYKLFRSHNGPPAFGSNAQDDWALSIHFSPDGVHWTDAPHRSGKCGDRTTVFYNPFRKVWVYSIRSGDGAMGRVRSYREGPDLLAAARWLPPQAVPWIGADRLDGKRADLNVQPQLYNLDCAPYESLLLGLFTIWRGQPRDRAKPNEVCLGFSRDGFHWNRPTHEAFIPVSERHGDWNWANVQSAGGGCLVVGDHLYFYVSGRAGVKGSAASGVSTTGLAVLRRDGFASMEAGQAGGTLTTRPVQFSGKHLFVNLDAPAGELRVEVLDEREEPLGAYTRKGCIPVRGDATLREVRWKGARDVARLAGKTVRFRFHLKQGSFYSFWVSPDPAGASRGYVAAGGPGFTGPTDTVGRSGS